MIQCHNCGTDNLDGSEFCDECGTKLAAAVRARTPNYMPPQSTPPPPPPSFTRDAVTPKPATPYTPPPPPVRQPAPASAASEKSAQSNNQTVTFNQQTNSIRSGNSNPGESRPKLVIQKGGKIGKEFPLTSAESMIGRWDADGGIFPDVDLDQDDPEAKISRRHARIVAQGSQFFIEDLGSTNGTFINRGHRLLPHIKHPLNHGDEIIVGKTFLKFFVN